MNDITITVQNVRGEVG